MTGHRVPHAMHWDLPVTFDVEGIPGVAPAQALAKIEAAVTAIEAHYRAVMLYTSSVVRAKQLGGATTTAALVSEIRAFQAALGLTADGVIGPVDLERAVRVLSSLLGESDPTGRQICRPVGCKFDRTHVLLTTPALRAA